MSESESRSATVRAVEESEATGQGRRGLRRHQGDQEHRLRAPTSGGSWPPTRPARAGLDAGSRR